MCTTGRMVSVSALKRRKASDALGLPSYTFRRRAYDHARSDCISLRQECIVYYRDAKLTLERICNRDCHQASSRKQAGYPRRLV